MQYVKELTTDPMEMIEVTTPSNAATELAPDVQLLAMSDKPFETSEMYQPSSEKKFVDVSLRNSSFRNFDTSSSAMFGAMERIVAEASALDKENDLLLVRNDISHIRYTEGGFFKAHADYTSVTSNIIEEYTLIMCVNPPGQAAPQGGETQITLNGQEFISKASVTPGGVLIFRKDLIHSGLPVLSGEKHIVTANLWGTRKRQLSSLNERILHVTFADETATANDQSVGRLRRLAADSSRDYVLSVSAVAAFEDSLLARHITFSDQQSDGEEAQIVNYRCDACCYQDFEIVYRILNRMRISAAELATHAPMLDYFQILDVQILVDLAAPPAAEQASDKRQEESKALLEIYPTTQTTTPLSSSNQATKAAMLASKLGDFYPVGEVGADFYATELNNMLVYRTGQMTVGDSELDFMSALKKMFGITEDFVIGLIEHQLTITIDEYYDYEDDFQDKLYEKYGSEKPDREEYDSDEEGEAAFEAALDDWHDSPLKLVRILCMHIVDSLRMMRHEDSLPEVAPQEEDDVIVCATLERSQVVAAAAVNMGLPYVPFRMFFVEGQIDTGGDPGVGADPRIVQMMPVFISLGDYDNIFCVRKILGNASLEQLSMQDIHTKHNFRDILSKCWADSTERTAHSTEEAHSAVKKLSNALSVCGSTIVFQQVEVITPTVHEITHSKRLCLKSYVSNVQQLAKVSEWNEWQELPTTEVTKKGFQDGKYQTITKSKNAIEVAEMVSGYSSSNDELERHWLAVTSVCNNIISSKLGFMGSALYGKLPAAEVQTLVVISQKIRAAFLEWPTKEKTELNTTEPGSDSDMEQWKLLQQIADPQERLIVIEARLVQDQHNVWNDDTWLQQRKWYVELCKLTANLQTSTHIVPPWPLSWSDIVSEKDQMGARSPVEIACTEDSDVVCFDLHLALPRDSAPGGIFTKAMQLSAGGPDGYDRAHAFPTEAIVLPGGCDNYFNKGPQKLLTDFVGLTPNTKKRRKNLSTSIRPSISNLFHIDSLGNTCFTAAEAKAASAHIATMELADRVQACIPKTKFLLPQTNAGVVDQFCNCQVYGNLNILMVNGVVKLA